MLNNFFTKLWYKFFNKEKYIDLKNEKRTSDQVKYYNSRIYAQILEIQKKIENNKELSFLHSGQLGDLIYSLATIKELSKSHKCKLYIQIDKPMPLNYGNSSKKVFISKRSGDLIFPLLRNQDFLDVVNIYKDGLIIQTTLNTNIQNILSNNFERVMKENQKLSNLLKKIIN